MCANANRRLPLRAWTVPMLASLIGGGSGGGDMSVPDAGGPQLYAGSCQLPSDLALTIPQADSSSEYVFSADHLLLYEIKVSDEEWQHVCQVGLGKATAEHNQIDDYPYTYADASLRVFDEYTAHVGLRFRGDISVETIFYPVGGDEDPEPEYQDCLQFRFARKPNFKIGVTEYGGSKFHDQKHLSFGGREGGSSMMHDYVISKMNQAFDLPGPRVTHTLVCINDIYRGVFTVQEEHDDQAFLNYHFPVNPDGTYYKVHDRGNQTFPSAVDLAPYRASYAPSAGTDEGDYTLDTDLIQFLQWANFTEPAQFAAEAASRLDVDAWLKVTAMETVLPDWDGLFAARHNYLLYHDPYYGWWPIRNDWDHGMETRLVDGDPASIMRLFELPIIDAFVPANRNLCDGRAPRDPNEMSCAGGCTQGSITHPVVQTRLMFAERDRYLDHVQTFLEDAFVPATVHEWIDERRQTLDPYYAAPQGDAPWLTHQAWLGDLDALEADIDLAHEQASAALQDARDNPLPVAPPELQVQMLNTCGEISCWPYACP